MLCIRCRSGNSEGRRVCAECGATLPRRCPVCGATNEPQESACGACGQSLLPGAAEPQRLAAVPPERRQITLLFCDMVGSTALSHQIDPEDLLRVVRDYQERTRQLAAPYDGHVAQFRGDGVLVYFGYPQAHEDDVARAILAGLAIVQSFERDPVRTRAAHGGAVQVRIGIATGLVVVGNLTGQGVAGQAEAMGETPNLAARLLALAQPNTVLIAQRTHDLAGGAFDYADRGEHALKGLPHPVRVWQVLGASTAQSRFDAEHGQRHARLVGRDAELQLLLGHWQRARQGVGRLVLLRGEAGIGKSRLAEAVEEALAGEAHQRLLYQCSPHHANSALHPIIRHFERIAGFLREDDIGRRFDKLQAMLERTTPNDAEVGALYATLLSLPAEQRYAPLRLSPQQRKDRTLAIMLQRLRALAVQTPVLLVFEDVHWIDPTTAELLALLASELGTMPVLAILTSRAAIDDPALARFPMHPVLLERLDSANARELLEQLLEGSGVPAEIADQVVARADGVPLFIEELAKNLTAADHVTGSPSAPHSPVPATLQDSLMARLDRLGQAREVAQIAAVVGREFTRELVGAVSALGPAQLDEALEVLTASALVQIRDAAPHRTFHFRHALLQDAAYASLLRGRRQELHGRIAGWLETNHPERARVEPELLAHHHAEAGAAATSARYRAAAAQRALERSANREALGQASQGLALMNEMAAGTERDRLELALEILRGAACRAVSGFAASQGEHSFKRALELSERLGDLPRRIDARRGLFACYYARGALAQAREQGQRLAELGAASGDTDSRMLGQWMLGCVTFWQGEFATARHALETAISLHDPKAPRSNPLAMQIDPGVNALLHLSWTLWILGHPAQAQRTSERAVDAARTLSQPFALAMALFWACATQACCGKAANAQKLLDELEALTTEHSLAYLGSCARVLQAQQLVARDRCAEGLQLIGRAFDEFKAQEAGVGLPWAISIAVQAHDRLGRTQEGIAALAGAMQAAARNGERHWQAELLRLKGELLLSSDSVDASGQAEVAFRAAIDLSRLQSARSLELRAATSLAHLLARQGRSPQARAVLSPVYGWFTEGLDTADLSAAHVLLDTLP